MIQVLRSDKLTVQLKSHYTKNISDIEPALNMTSIKSGEKYCGYRRLVW